MDWTKIPAGVKNAAEQRLWVAFGNNADAVANGINNDPDYLARLVMFATSTTKFVDEQSLLEAITTAEVPSIASFVAKEKFRSGKEIDGVKIYWLGDNFKENFLNKKETDIAPATLRIQKLKNSSLDTPILAELGDKAETTMAHFWELLKQQGSGQKGNLLVNGYANIAYIRDENGVLWAVCAYWSSGRDGWDVVADAVECPDEWNADDQVVSR